MRRTRRRWPCWRAARTDQLSECHRASPARDSALIERSTHTISSAWHGIGFDVRYAARSMRRQVAFTAAVVTILALGIGATTAAYVVIHAVLLRALPYPDSQQIVVIAHATPTGDSQSFAAADWLDYRARNESTVALASYASWPMNLTGRGDPERLRSIIVSGNFFHVMGSRPALGRVATPADDTPAAPGVVVLSDAFWRARFGGLRSVVGISIVINGRPATVIGVMPPDFAVPTPHVDLWMPMGLGGEVLADRAGEWLSMIGRLRPNVDMASAQSALTATSSALAREHPATNRDERALVRPLLDQVVGGIRRPLWLGGFAALFVLIAGCANAANLMLARATLRRDEIALRAALGAEPVRLARQLLVESAMLAGVGGSLGVVAAAAFLRSFVVLADGRLPRIDQLQLDPAALVFALSASLLTAFVFGGAAAWLLLRDSLSFATRHDLQRVTRHNRVGGVFLACQVAFAAVLVVGATVVVRAYAATMRIDPGFDISDTLTMQLTLPRHRYSDMPARVRFAERAVAEISTVPGVKSVGVVSDLPFVGNAMHFAVRRQGQPVEGAPQMTVRPADAGFFRTLRIPLRAGRTFDLSDRADAAPVAVLNRSAAERLASPTTVGYRVQIGSDAVAMVVGVVGNIRHEGLQRVEGPVVYVPFSQSRFDFLTWMGIVVRGSAVTKAAGAVKAAVANVDASQPVTDIQSMEGYVDEEMAPFRFSSLVVGTLAGAAQVIAITGIYGLTAFTVGRRSRELGVRLALGASRGGIVRLVFKQIALMLVSGLLIGLMGAMVIERLLKTVLEGSAVGTGDAVGIVVGAGFLAVTAAVAALGPALRAARLDPRVALMAE